MCWRKTFPGCGRLGGLGPLQQNELDLRRAGRFYADQYHGRNLQFRRSRTRYGRIVNGMTLSKLRLSARHSSISAIICAQHAPGCPDGNPGDLYFTHDSIGLGEDGPTHQPIEQLASLRAMPNMLFCAGRPPMKWWKLTRSSCSMRTDPCRWY